MRAVDGVPSSLALTQSPLTSLGKPPDHQSPLGFGRSDAEGGTAPGGGGTLCKTRLSSGLCIHIELQRQRPVGGSRIYYFSGGKGMATNVGLTLAVTSSSSAAFRVSLSHHCRLHPSHLRCFPWGEGASPISVEPRGLVFRQPNLSKSHQK